MKKIILILLTCISSVSFAVFLQGDSFTYQGELIVNGQVANGNYEFEAQFYDAPTSGNNIASNFNIATTVTDGLFTLQLDIGDGAFVGDAVWIELLVTPAGGGTQVSLLPRQLITNSPYSIQAKHVGNDGVSTMSIINTAVTTAKLANNAVTSAKLAGDSVTSAKIANGTIETADISSQAVTRVQIAANTIQRSEVDSTQIQERITGTCAAGSSIRVIAQDGTVTCETDDAGGGSAGWGLTGNSGTNPATDFIGTTDNTKLTIKVNNIDGINLIPTTHPAIDAPNAVIASTSSSMLLNADTSASVIIAGRDNEINPNTTAGGLVLIGGFANKIKNTAGNNFALNNSTILGGQLNVIENTSMATIVGGTSNKVSQLNSIILGGANNSVSEAYSAAIAGTYNIVNGTRSIAAGFSSTVSHNGSFVWSDFSTSTIGSGLTTTADNQFLVRAEGGFGIGTNAPGSPLHIKGQGTTFGTITDEVVMTVEPKTTTDDVALAINKLDVSQESALVFAISNEPEFDIRTSSTITRSMIDFNSYDNLGNPTFMLRINDKATNRIDFNANAEPQIDNTFNLGSEFFRWSTIYAQNPLNTPSDKRLKQDIKDMDYGLAEILAMHPVTYHWKKGDTQRVNLGLIAQEVESIVPEIVNKAKDEMQTRSMRYAELIPVLIKATQEQQALIEQQNSKIAKLESMLAQLVHSFQQQIEVKYEN